MAGLIFDIFAQDKTARAFSSVNSKINGLKGSLNGLAGKLGSIGGLLAGAFTATSLKGVAETADKINDLSNRLRISTEVLSQYQLVASEVGVENESIAKSMQMLAKNSVTAAEGGGAARDAFNQLGINAALFKNLGIDQQFAVLSEAMQSVENPSERVKIAMDLMGKSGAEMLQVMELGGEGLQDLQKEADRLGVTLSKTQAEDIGGMMDAIGALGLTIKGLAQDIMAFLAPAVKFLAKALTEILLGAINVVKWGFTALKRVFDEVIAFFLRRVGDFLNMIAKMQGILAHLPGGVGDSFQEMAAKTQNYADVLKAVKVEAQETNKTYENTAVLLDKVKGGLPKTTSGLEGVATAGKHSADSMKELNDNIRLSANSMKLSADSMKSTADSMKENFAMLEKKMTEGATKVQDAWVDALFGIGGGFGSLKETALNSLKEIGASMVKNVLNKSLNLNGAGGGGFTASLWKNPDSGQLVNSGGGMLSSIAGGLGNFFGGFFAEGGNFMGGKPIIVGERGAEMIIPKSGGTVIPNNALMRPVVVNMNISTPDANSFRRSSGQISAALAESVRRGNRNL